jgi:hypothetical protein
MHIRRTVICVRLYNIIPHYLINGTIFGKRYWNKKCVLIFLYNFYPKYLTFWEELKAILSKINIVLYVKYPFFQILM